MIQRIQSIYILIVAILNGLLFVLPLNLLPIENGTLKVSILGLFQISEEKTTLVTELFPLLVLTSIIVAIALISLFLFKKRKLQMRFSIYNTILGLSLSFLAVYYTMQIADTNSSKLSFCLGLLLPTVSSVFSFLAFRAIKKDDDLVKSVDRIR